MNPKIWGPHGWYFLHCVTLEYPNKPTLVEKNEIKRLFFELQNTLPCIECRENYKKHLVKRPLTLRVLSSRTSLACWLIDIHNDVNRMLKKPIMSYEKALNIHKKN